MEASFGLGEALVSGLVNADVYKVRDGEIVARAIATKQLAIHRLAGRRDAGTGDRARATGAASADGCAGRAARAAGPADRSALRPSQDIEWCLVDDDFQIVQSRPITTLFPIPAAGDQENHVYVSVGHQQMMTDPMKPLGLSVWQLTALRPMNEAGGRLFVDVTRAPGVAGEPRKPPGGHWGESDPLIGDALQTILDRGDFIPSLPDDGPARAPPARRARRRSRPIRRSSPS